MEKIQDLLECPVCREFPRIKPLYTCTRGCRPLCGDCKPKLTFAVCPSCRDPSLTPNLLLGKIADIAMENTEIKCMNRLSGCTTKRLGKVISIHEERCSYREVGCPNKHGGSKKCHVRFPLCKLPQHHKSTDCIRVVGHTKMKSTDEFQSVVHDSSDGLKAFESRTDLHWKPVIFGNNHALQYLAYLTLTRVKTGIWHITPWSYAHQSLLSTIRIRIRISKWGPTESEPTAFMYTGKVNSHMEPMDLPKACGITLNDNQVRNLSTETDTTPSGRILFKYSVFIFATEGKQATHKASYMPRKRAYNCIQFRGPQESNSPSFLFM